MSDTSNPYAAGFFFANEPGVNLKMREKIALAQMMQKRAIPKTLGEGIFSFGDSIADALMARNLQSEDRQAQLVASKLGAPKEPGAITPVSSAPQEIEPTPPIATAQRIVPAPGNLPPTGEPGNTGADTFPPPFQPSPAAPPPPPRTWPAPGPIAPPQPYPPPAPAVRPSVADYGQKLALAPTPPPAAPAPPIVAEDAASLSPEAQQQRRTVALAMLRQQGGQGGPSPPAPTPAPTPPPPAPDQGVRLAPPVQMAQPAPVPGYVPPAMADPTGAPIIPPTKREMELQAVLSANSGNPHAETSPAARELKYLGEVRARKQEDANKLFEASVVRATKREEQRQQGLMDQSKRVIDVERGREEVTEARQKNTLRAQFGNMPPDEVFKSVTESHKVANSAAKSLQASQAAMAAFDAPGGVITGSGANMRLDVAKFFTQMGLVDKGNVIANTETFRNAMAPVVASIMHQTSGTSQLSEGELRFAQRAAAGDITLDPGSIKQLMTIIDKGSKGIISDHQRKVDVLFGDSPQAKATFGVETPKPPAAAQTKDDEALDWAVKNPNDPRAVAIRQRLGR